MAAHSFHLGRIASHFESNVKVTGTERLKRRAAVFQATLQCLAWFMYKRQS